MKSLNHQTWFAAAMLVIVSLACSTMAYLGRAEHDRSTSSYKYHVTQDE